MARPSSAKVDNVESGAVRRSSSPGRGGWRLWFVVLMFTLESQERTLHTELPLQRASLTKTSEEFGVVCDLRSERDASKVCLPMLGLTLHYSVIIVKLLCRCLAQIMLGRKQLATTQQCGANSKDSASLQPDQPTKCIRNRT